MPALIILIIVLVTGVITAVVSTLLEKRQDHAKFDREVVNSARQKADEIIASANNEAVRIISQASTLAKDSRKDLNQKLGRASSVQQRKFQETLAQLSKSIQTSSLDEVSQFRQAMQLETAGIQKIVAQKTEEQLAQAKTDIESYKKAEMAQIDSKVTAAVKSLSLHVFGKSISPKEHQQLIIAALEEARKNHVF